MELFLCISCRNISTRAKFFTHSVTSKTDENYSLYFIENNLIIINKQTMTLNNNNNNDSIQF